MREANRTTRQRIADRLRDDALQAGPSPGSSKYRPATRGHVEHISKSLDSTDEQLLVAPPTCDDCGFDAFDDLVNRPSRCPECKSESVTEPAYRIN